MKIKSKIKYLVYVSGTSLLGLIIGALMQSTAFAATGTYYKWTGTDSTTAGLNGCASNCWSVAGNWDVSTDGGSTYATATTAPQSSDNSGTGDNLVFNNSSLAANTTLNNDISNLVVNSLTSAGSGVDDYTISGNSFSLTSGELSYGSSNSPDLFINNNITIAASQNYGVINQDESIMLYGTITVPSNVTLTAASILSIDGLTGSGNVVFEGLNSSQSTSGSFNNFSLYNSSTISGNITIQSGAELQIQNNNSLGTASLTIDNGGQLNISLSGTTTNDSITLPNAITMGGQAGAQALESLGAIEGSYVNSSTGVNENLNVTLSGLVTLTANTALSSSYNSNVTYNFTGTLNQAGFTLTPIATVQPTYGTTIIEVKGVQLVAAPTTPAPKTPDTGAGLVSSHFELPLIGGALLAGAFILMALTVPRKLSKATSIRRK